ncbi:hypothetical protein GCM10020229_60610 [Kitasatospora albolonga]|uniref:scabin-related ADP-ribosyltransferase n=1 Tax=Kitasatospora albolonga TaxID=68173 RepID=UPI0031E79A06
MEQIFEDGFTPRGDYLAPLDEYIVKGGGQNTAHLSTSCEKWVAQRFATYGAAKTGWVYEIEAPGGIDVNATAAVNGYQSPYLWNKEIDFPAASPGSTSRAPASSASSGPTPRPGQHLRHLGCKTNDHFDPAAAVSH